MDVVAFLVWNLNPYLLWFSPAWTGVKCTFILPVYDIFCCLCVRFFWVLKIHLYTSVLSSVNRNGSPVYNILVCVCVRFFWVLKSNLYPTVMSSINRNGSPLVVRAQIPSTRAKCWFHQRDFGKTDRFILRFFYKYWKMGKFFFIPSIINVCVRMTIFFWFTSSMNF